MKHLKIMGLCLVAVFAIAAVAASSASALPEWGQCVAKAGGKYSDGNCVTKAKLGTGTFEFHKGPEVAQKKFEGHNVGSGGVLTAHFHGCSVESRRAPTCRVGEEETVAEPITIECESETNHGEAAGTKEVKNVTVKFLGCKVFGSAPCSNGTNVGEILVNILKGSLGYINKATKEVGLLLEPAQKKGEFAKFTCAGILTTVVGVGNKTEGAAYAPETTGGFDGIISPITPVNTMSKEFTQVYTTNEAAENVPSHFAGKHNELLESYLFNNESGESTKWSPAGETITNVNTQSSGEEVEIKA